MRRIIDGARENTLGSSAYAGTTVTINNTGALGSVTSQPILPEGTSAILTLEAITRRPVVVGNDAIAIRPMANLCLTFDHRVLDGQEACAFLQELKSELERLSATTAIH
jgi:2-oxoisovalerate dehydrogenase E2 component (dihydrolipoyl transacylase)